MQVKTVLYIPFDLQVMFENCFMRQEEQRMLWPRHNSMQQHPWSIPRNRTTAKSVLLQVQIMNRLKGCMIYLDVWLFLNSGPNQFWLEHFSVLPINYGFNPLVPPPA